MINIAVVDLKHSDHSCNAVPLGAGLVASSLIKAFGATVSVQLFKEPALFSKLLETVVPDIVCFSHYLWNSNLSYAFASRIKKRSPSTITIFGGPHLPIEASTREEFLREHSDIDFYIYGEGEAAVVELISALLRNPPELARDRVLAEPTANCLCLWRGQLSIGEIAPTMADLDSVPSPYLTGLLDEYLAGDYVPIVQTARGCPFRCTYCQDGDQYHKQLRRYSFERVTAEIRYIAARTRIPNLHLADLNFGMYKEDIPICEEIARIQEETGWPKYFIGIDGKNNKDRVIQAASIVKGAHLTAAVQSTDPQVLANIQRDNVSLEHMVQVAKQSEKLGANSFSELILCLPGDTKEAHFKSNFTLIDAGINVVRAHQFIMLPGSRASTMDSRAEFGMQTRFRVVPKTASAYQLFEETFYAPEVDEICVENDTMSFDDYLQCRLFNLSVEVFYNDSVFYELLKFLRFKGIVISDFILAVHQRASGSSSNLSELFAGFLNENLELYDSLPHVKESLSNPSIIERYVKGELGNNEQLKYRALAIFKHMDDLHMMAFSEARKKLEESSSADQDTLEYLEELQSFCLARKIELLDMDWNRQQTFHYDFLALLASDFEGDPFRFRSREGICIEFRHSESQKKLLSEYIRLYGSTDYGLGNILSNCADLMSFYRKTSRV
jgi:radical SAM superfamily enzyme YgiQ (UPF0313 family)